MHTRTFGNSRPSLESVRPRTRTTYLMKNQEQQVERGELAGGFERIQGMRERERERAYGEQVMNRELNSRSHSFFDPRFFLSLSLFIYQDPLSSGTAGMIRAQPPSLSHSSISTQ